MYLTLEDSWWLPLTFLRFNVVNVVNFVLCADDVEAEFLRNILLYCS